MSRSHDEGVTPSPLRLERERAHIWGTACLGCVYRQPSLKRKCRCGVKDGAPSADMNWQEGNLRAGPGEHLCFTGSGAGRRGDWSQIEYGAPPQGAIDLS